MKHSYPTLEPLRFLLEMIHNRAMALPDFQRDFVWDPYATDELIESIISNYPAGTLLRIKNGQQLLFQPRAFEGAPELKGAKPAYLILDGQQRLTSLYQAFYSKGEHRYYEETSGPAVCMIFETLNRTGVKLSVYDLLTARFWPQDFNLRQKWEEAQDETPILEEFRIDPYYILQVIALLEPGADKDGKSRAPSIKRSAILEMKVEQARRGWNAAVNGLSEALSILRDDCGVLESGLLPYNTIVIPMGAVWATQKEVTGADVGASRVKILRWFWCSVFGQKYENAPNSQAEKDFAELQRWMKGGEPPESVSEFKLEVNLRQVKPRQRAVYRGVMALILQNGALDFHKRGKVTSQLLADERNPVDDHHIFPRTYLDKRAVSASLRDCIINRTFIDRITNRRLSKRAPSDYFNEIQTKQGDIETNETLSSHILPTGTQSPLLDDDFEKFLDWREQALLNIIRQKTKN